MSRYCPRCKEEQPEILFEYPLSMCLVCYARIPGNVGLELNELRLKCKKSYSANFRIRKQDANELKRAMLQVSARAVREVDNMPETYIPIECDWCHEEFPLEEIAQLRLTGEPRNCCQACLPEAQSQGADVLLARTGREPHRKEVDTQNKLISERQNENIDKILGRKPLKPTE